MGLLQKLKAALGLDGARSPDAGTRSSRDVDVTVEREPSSGSEDAVKGTETAPPEPETADEPDDGGEPTSDEEAGDEDREVDDAGEGTDAVDEPEDDDEESEADADEGAADDGATDPVTEISGIGPAYGERLEAAGVESVGDLAGADADALAEETDISASRIEGWVDAAGEY